MASLFGDRGDHGDACVGAVPWVSTRYNLATTPMPEVHDLRTLDLAGFSRWLDLHLSRWASDPVFVQRSRIRDLRRAHPKLKQLERDHVRAVRADGESEQGPRLKEIEGQLYDIGKAMADWQML